MSTDYLVTFTYLSGADLKLQMFNGACWVDIGTLPGRTARWSASVVVPCSSFYDALPDVPGMNAELRFSTALWLYYVDAVSYSYETDFSTNLHYPGVMPEASTAWHENGGALSSDAWATMLVNVPRTDIQYELRFEYQDTPYEMWAQQLTSTGWLPLGPLVKNGQSASILLSSDYYDALPDVGLNVRIIFGGPIDNLTSVEMLPVAYATDIGIAGDTDLYGHILGLNINNDNGWIMQPTTVDGRSVRQTGSGPTYFMLNGPVTTKNYQVVMEYKSTQTGSITINNGATEVTVGTIANTNGGWQDAILTINPSQYFDSIQNGEMNLRFRIYDSGTCYVDTLRAYVDNDGDTLTDVYEACRSGNTYNLDPFSTDTDQDNLADNLELTAGTNPTNPDTDADGLMDGGEVWSQCWSTNSFYALPEGPSSNVNIPISVPALTRVTGAQLCVGVIHPIAFSLIIYAEKDNEPLHVAKYHGDRGGPNVFESYNMLSLGYQLSDFNTAHTWHVVIVDYDADGQTGQVQYARIMVSGTTNPLNHDTDGDGIYDGEEVTPGADGYVTNPVLADTDGDGLSDYNEIHNINTPCGHALDPTMADTDGDGYADNVDEGFGDMMLEIDINQFTDYTGHSVPNGVFFSIVVNGNNIATTRTSISSGGNQYPSLKYYVDVPDTSYSVSMNIQAWEDSPTCNWLGDDKLLMIQGSSTCQSPTYVFNLGNQPLEYHGNDITVYGTLKTYDRQKTQTTVITGTDGNTSYGLDTASDGTHRFNADQQVYVLYVSDLDGGDSHFTSGLNTIILPRSVALQSQLNYTFEDLLHRLSGTVLNGATLYDTNTGATTSSGNVIMVISTSLYTYQAESLLSMLTHDHSGKRVGDNVTLSGSEVYTMHLPGDVLRSVASQDINNSPFGSAPQYVDGYTLFNYFVAVITLPYVLAISALNFAASLVTAAANMGLYLIGVIATAISAAVTAAENAVVDAFNAFVAWAVTFIRAW